MHAQKLARISRFAQRPCKFAVPKIAWPAVAAVAFVHLVVSPLHICHQFAIAVKPCTWLAEMKYVDIVVVIECIAVDVGLALPAGGERSDVVDASGAAEVVVFGWMAAASVEVDRAGAGHEKSVDLEANFGGEAAEVATSW